MTPLAVVLGLIAVGALLLLLVGGMLWLELQKEVRDEDDRLRELWP